MNVDTMYFETGGRHRTEAALKSREFFSYEHSEVHKMKGRKIREIVCKPR